MLRSTAHHLDTNLQTYSNPDRGISIFWEDNFLKTSYSSTIQICNVIQLQKEILHTVVFVELVWNAALERQWSSFLWAQRGAQEAKDLYDKRSMGVLKSHWQCASASKTQLFSWITKRCSDVGLLCILECFVNTSKKYYVRKPWYWECNAIYFKSVSLYKATKRCSGLFCI